MLGNEFPGGVSQAIAHKIYINDGLGSFTDESALRFVVGTASDLWGEHSEVLDIDYDGDLDFVVLRKSTTKDIQVYLNNGAGVFSLGTAYSFTLPGAGSAFGADLDVSDIDGDGSYDLWAGLAGEKVRPLINSYRRPDGTPADAPQAFRVVTTSSGTVTLAWRAPDFAATNRSYRVYRSTTSELGRSDQTLLKVIALSRHEDEGFFAPITRFTTTSRLADAQVTLNGAMNEVEFRDTTAVPGVKYQYWVAHVGVEHTESVHVGPLEASGGAGASGADTQAPQLDIVGPTRDEFSVYPRLVLTYGDGQSGIDVASLRISFNQALTGSSPRAANADVSDLFFRKDAQAFVSVLGPMLSLPASTLVTMTVSIDDAAGNRATRTVQFVTGAAPGSLPVAVAAVSPLNGTAVMVSNCSGAASTDSDGKIVSWEWAFGDGSTLNGRVVDKTWTRAGTFAVTLVVRDNEGGVGVAQQMVTVAANPDAGAGSGGADAGSADAGSADAGSSDAGSADAGPGVGGVDAGGVFDAGLLDAGYKNDAGNVDGGRSGDAGQDIDGGAPGTPQVVGGCGCGSLAGVGWAGALGLIVALRRRRPRTKKCE